MKETNLTSSPRLKGRCCLTDFLYSKTTLLLLIFMLPLMGLAQMPSDKEIRAKLESEGINVQKHLDAGYTLQQLLDEVENPTPVTRNQTAVYARTTDISDVCSSAVQLTCDEEADGSTVGTTNAGYIDCGGGPSTGLGVWYKVIGNNYDNTVEVIASDFNVQLHVYASIDGDCNSLQCAGGTSGQGSPSVTFFAPIDDVFYINVVGAGSQTGTFTLDRTSTGPCNDTPPGDGLSSASAFVAECGNVYSGDTTGFGNTEVGRVDCSTNISTGSIGVWYRINVTADYPAGTGVTLDLCGSGFDTEVNVYQGAGLDCVGYNDDSFSNCGSGGRSYFEFEAQPDTDYYIYIAGWSSGSNGTGPYEMSVQCDGVAPPPPPQVPNNDLCPDAQEITCQGSEYIIAGSTVLATDTNEPPSCTDTSTGNTLSITGVGVWYFIDGDGSNYTLTTCGYDTKLHVYTGSCGAFQCVTADDDATTAQCTTNSFESQVNFDTVDGERYYIYVSSFGSSTQNPFDLYVQCIPPPEPPANDDCANAEPIACGGFTSGNTGLAESDTIPVCGDNTETTANGVWYSFTTTTPGEDWITASSIGITMETIVNVYTGGCNGLVCVDGDNGSGDDSEVTWLAQSGTEYLIFVAGDDGTTGAFELELSCAPDPCQNATLISCSSGVVYGSNSGASGSNVDQPNCGSTANTPGFMYELIGEDSFVEINTCGSNYDTNLNVYTGSCGNLQCVTGNDDWSDSSSECGVSFRSRVGFFANEGQSYYIWVNGYSGASGDFQLNISCDQPEPNDLCDAAVRVSCGTSIDGSTTLSTGRDKPTDDCSGSSPSDQGVWYVVAGTGGDIEVSLCETTYDAKLLVLEGECGDLTCVAGNNDGSACGVFNQPFVTFSSEYGQDYYIYVTGYNTTLGGTRFGDFTLNVDCLCTPGALEECVTLYDGYEEFVTLTPVLQLADGEVSYLWSTGATTQSIDVSVAEGNLNYSVTMTDESGCGATKTYFVYVADVDCDRNDNSDKVELCHNGQSICVSWEAVDSHLAHGDSLGVCGSDTCADAVPSCDSVLTSETTDVDINTTITWNAPSAGFVDYYVLSVGTTSGGTDIVDNENVGEVLSYNLSGLAYETTYYVSIVPYNGNGPANVGCSESTFTTMDDPTPENDLCSGAIAVNCGDIITGSTEFATADMAGVDDCDEQYDSFNSTYSAPGVWYSILGDGSTVTATTCGFDTKLGVFTGSCGALSCYAGNDDDSQTGCLSFGESQVEFATVDGETYYIFLTGYSGTGDYTLEISCEDPPEECNDPTVFVNIETDFFGSETSWEVRDESGAVVAEGDGYSGNSSYTVGLCLPDGCYDFIIFDSFGDGIYSPDGYSVTTAGGDTIVSDFSNLFSSSATTSFCLPYVAPPSNCNNMTVSVGGGAWQSEVSWSITNSGGTVIDGFVGTTQVELPDGDYTFNMFDSFGDGWNGNTYTVIDGNGSTISSGTLGSGSFGSNSFTVACSSTRLAYNTSSLVSDWSMAPNPTRGNVTLDLSNYLQSDVTIEVVNVTGKVIFNTSVQNLQGSKYEVELNSSLPAGMYFVRVAAQGQVSTKKLMIMR